MSLFDNDNDNDKGNDGKAVIQKDSVTARVESLVDLLFGPFSGGSHERHRHLVDLIEHEPPEVFWPVFNRGWPCCEWVGSEGEDLLALIRHHRQPEPLLVNAADRAFYASLPEEFAIYRGGSRGDVRSFSWTTDEEVARSFTLVPRGIGHVPDPVLARATIRKSDVISALADREERTVIVDPDELGEIEIETIAVAAPRARG